MKQIFATIIICICALAMVDFSRAADPNVYIEWTYSNPPIGLAGFYLYVNDARIQDFGVPTATSWSGPIVLVDGNNTFELTAYDVAKQESGRSAPHILNYDAPPSGIPVIMDVVIN